eukprot:2305609-Pleurochrysis_carterae.AAC.2
MPSTSSATTARTGTLVMCEAQARGRRGAGAGQARGRRGAGAGHEHDTGTFAQGRALFKQRTLHARPKRGALHASHGFNTQKASLGNARTPCRARTPLIQESTSTGFVKPAMPDAGSSVVHGLDPTN